jgi:alpha-ketoglutarate-dependent 2,4-dichlorophenoxyacetate dioxygenase
MLAVTPLDPPFAATATGIDLRRPLDGDDRAALTAAMARHAVLVLPGQPLDDARHMAFSASLGPLERSREADRPNHRMRLGNAYMIDVSNVGLDGNALPRDDFRRVSAIANRLWHVDSSYKDYPATWSLLSARAIPDAGGDTEFADCAAAYDALDAATKAQIANLEGVHSIATGRAALGFTDFTPEERAALPPKRHPLVRTLADGRKSLFIGAHVGEIVGLPVAEARILLADLTEHATQRRFVYRHRWSVGDLVMWDNRRTMHRGRAYDMDLPRDIRRTTLSDRDYGPSPVA